MMKIIINLLGDLILFNLILRSFRLVCELFPLLNLTIYLFINIFSFELGSIIEEAMYDVSNL